MILEGLVTTVSAAGTVNVAPMGPHFVANDDKFQLKPFQNSQTYKNLMENPCGVLHVTDDILLMARSAIDQLNELPDMTTAVKINGSIIDSCCRFYEFQAREIPTPESRKAFHCTIVRAGKNNEFYGFNRAKHAVLEATILATRIDFLPIEEIRRQYQQFRTIVEKTGGPNEMEAFSLLNDFIDHTSLSPQSV